MSVGGRPDSATARPRWSTSCWHFAHITTPDPPRQFAARWGFSPKYWPSVETWSRVPRSLASRSAPVTALVFPEFTNTVAHLREVLGDETYESLADRCAAMTTAAI